MKNHALPLAASLLAAVAVATPDPDPGLFDGIESVFHGVKSVIKADASSVAADWSSVRATATATATTTAAGAPSSTATSLAQNVSSLTYPRCSPDAARAWCGIVFGGDGRSDTFNVSITDSACRQVALRTDVARGDVEAFSTDVGRWTFGVGVGGSSAGLNMTYDGRNISDYQTAWDSWAIEQYDAAGDGIVIYGGITNCTSADDESSKSSAAAGRAVAGAGAVAVVAAVVGMFGVMI